MLLAGTYEVTIDDKGRILLPAKFRSAFGEQVLLVRLADQDSCVRVYGENAWKEFEERYIEPLDEFGSQTDNWLIKDIYSNLHPVAPDKAGRVLVPRDMIKELELHGRLRLNGARDHLEIWNPDTYLRERAEKGARRDS